jgi:hypothetical protein
MAKKRANEKIIANSLSANKKNCKKEEEVVAPSEDFDNDTTPKKSTRGRKRKQKEVEGDLDDDASKKNARGQKKKQQEEEEDNLGDAPKKSTGAKKFSKKQQKEPSQLQLITDLLKNDDVFNDVPNDVLVLSNDDDEDLSDDNEAAPQRSTIIPMSILETSQNPRTMVNDHIPSNKTVPSTSRMSTPYYSRENEQLRNDHIPSNKSAPPASRMRTTSPYPRENSQFRNDYISRMTTPYSRGNGQL